MANLIRVDNENKTMTVGYMARSKVRVVVNKKRSVVRVPALLHRMSIWSQRRWCKRNRVEFISPHNKKIEAVASALVA